MTTATKTVRSMASSSLSSSHLRPTSEQVQRVSGQIQAVRQRISQAASHAKRRDPPRLVAISKLHPPTSILAAHTSCSPPQIHFGENYAQELESKAKVLPSSVKWHFVGKLQSNKAKVLAAIPNLYLVETLDSVKAAQALQKALVNLETKREGPLRVYLQVNTSGEDAKGGLPPLGGHGQDDKGGELVQLAQTIIQDCDQLELSGLMTIGAAAESRKGDGNGFQSKEEALEANSDFRVLSETRLALVRALRQAKVESKSSRYTQLLSGDDEEGGLELSMGMSADLEVAIWAGSDNVRVGTDCFGVRPKSRDEAMESMKHELEPPASA